MPQIPENWISIEQKEDFPLQSSNNFLSNYPDAVLKILVKNGFDSEQKIIDFVKTDEGRKFTGFLSKYCEIFLKILLNRGIYTQENIYKYLKSPQGKDFYDPFLLPNMDTAVERLLKAIKNNENILIFGDYDADGIISTTLIYNFLKKLGLNVQFKIPSRVEDGYDISLEFIKKLNKEQPSISLIICVDCGSNSNEVKEYISKNKDNPDIIVCDHHKMSDSSLPYLTDESRFIIVNPHDRKSNYPFRYLSGGGVTFKFINAVLIKLEAGLKNLFEKSYLTDLLDLIAISTIADLMPLTDENRLIVKWGLEVLKDSKNTGLKKLIELTLPQKNNLTVYDVGYIIAPRLNASGRIKDAEKSFKLLTCNLDEAECLINEVNEFNNERKKMQDEMLKGIISNKEFDFDYIKKYHKIFIEKSPDWPEGLLGIVASDLVKILNIPVLLFKEDKKKYKGSGRSINEFDLYDNLSKLSMFFKKFGGHRMACGLTLKDTSNDELPGKENKENNYLKFKKEMIKIAYAELSAINTEKKYYYDLEINFDDLSISLARQLKLLEPFGIENSKPVFLIKDCKIMEIISLKNGKHLSMKIKNKGSYKKAIYFNIKDEIIEKLNKIPTDTRISILSSIEETIYNNSSYLQLVILDLFY